MSFAYDPKYLHKLADSLRNSRGLAKLSLALRVLRCHLGAESAVCNGRAPRKAALSSRLQLRTGSASDTCTTAAHRLFDRCSPRASSVGGTVKSGAIAAFRLVISPESVSFGRIG